MHEVPAVNSINLLGSLSTTEVEMIQATVSSTISKDDESWAIWLKGLLRFSRRQITMWERESDSLWNVQVSEEVGAVLEDGVERKRKHKNGDRNSESTTKMRSAHDHLKL